MEKQYVLLGYEVHPYVPANLAKVWGPYEKARAERLLALAMAGNSWSWTFKIMEIEKASPFEEKANALG